jgi:predicted lipid-binding transport protein (Tim44 family)
MSRQYRQYFTQGNHLSMRFRIGDPYGNQRNVEADMKRQFDEQAAKNQPRPEKSADETREDRQVFIGLINGVLIGGVLSGVGGYLAKWSVITICFAVLGGVVVGGLIGAMITRLVLWMNSRKEKPASPDKNNQTHI